MPRLPKKQWRKKAEIETEAKIKTKWKLKKKKPLEVSFREHIGKMIDRVDPLEVVAILGTTYLVHNFVSLHAELQDAIRNACKPPVDLWAILGVSELKGEIEEQLKKIEPMIEVTNWLTCFALAYIIVKNPLLITQGLGSALKLLLI